MRVIADLSREYTEYLRSLNYSPDTVRKARERLGLFDRWLFDTCRVQTIDKLLEDHLRRWHRHLSTLRTRKGYLLQATTINRHIITVRGLITYLSSGGYIQNRLINALPYVKEPKRLPSSVLTHGQVRRLLCKISTDSPEGYRNRAMFELLYSSGIRAGELLSSNVEDINIRNRTALVEGKGRKQRMVPVGRTAIRYLETYIIAVRPFLARNTSEKALFLGRDGRRLSYQIFRRIVRSVADRSGLDVYITAHTFRRSCTTELIRGGANMYHVKELLGHESVETLSPYVRLTIMDLKKTHKKCHPRERDRD